MVTKLRNMWIDFIKGMAMISVILYHIGFMRFGYLGVDIFLVINGFLIKKSIEKTFFEESLSFWDFIVRRINRLWTLVVLAGAVAFVLGYFTMLPDDYENLCETIVASNLFVNNVLQAITTRNYWDIVQTFKPLMHTWYLGILLQCYICALFVLMPLKKIIKTEKTIFIVLLILTAISFGLYLFIGDATQKFYYLPFRFWEFGIGGVVACISHRFGGTEQGTDQACGLSFFAIAFLLAALLGIDGNMVSNEVRLVLTVIGTAVAMFFVTKMERLELPFFCKIFSYIGIASYSLYIWHQIVLAFWKYIVDDSMKAWSAMFCLVLSILLGILSYWVIERKISQWKSMRLFICTAFMCVVTTALGFGIYLRAGVVRDVPELGVYTDNVHRGMHSEYCDRPYGLDKDFQDDSRIKVLAIGNSFVRDWVNVLLESDLSEMLDISYIYSSDLSEKHVGRIGRADYIFCNASTLLSVDSIPPLLLANKKDAVDLWGVGTKCYGNSNGNIYNRRFREDYYGMTRTYSNVYVEYREELENIEHYIDFIAPVLEPNGEVRVFADTNMYISQDGRHLTEAGAKYYAKILDLNGIFGMK